SRGTANKALARLTQLGWLLREGSSRRPRFRPGLLRQVVQRYPLAGLQEDRPWARDFAPCFELPHEVRRMTQHIFGELLNNAIDHSRGTQVRVSMRCNATHLHLLVVDDGCGVFDRIGTSFGIDDPQEAMLELSKGKLTTQPLSHSGRGLFFTSRLVDIFDLHANGLAYQYLQWTRRDWLSHHPLNGPGTAVFVSIALNTQRTMASMLRDYSTDPTVLRLERTVVPLRLVSDADLPLISRAQARRVLARLDQFVEADLDFEGVSEIGQGFADEVFRVYPGLHPQVRLAAKNMNPSVAAMVRGVHG
ncbi:MAG: hypothetical protein JWP52_1269, partial [Rhizobacter sp.]|nr:hypothetical protein [Rhizobacter sp.]